MRNRTTGIIAVTGTGSAIVIVAIILGGGDPVTGAATPQPTLSASATPTLPATLTTTPPPPLPTTAKPSLAPAPAPLASLVDRLRVADEGGPDYDRDEFGSRAPTSTTRKALLAAEQRADGSWYSKWDGKSWKDPSRVDADHTVALAEAWSSGAHSWTKAKRVRYANDLTSPFTLNLITDTLNQRVKSDKDPFDWLPDVGRCQYVREWTSVKLAWGLTADAEEKMALHNAAEECES